VSRCPWAPSRSISTFEAKCRNRPTLANLPVFHREGKDGLMTITLRLTCQWLAALSPFVIAITALGQSPSSQVGREVAIPIHLPDGEEFTTPIVQLIQYGAQLFNARFTAQEGAGRPKSKGTGAL
jgi:hypothetical protein